MMNFELIFDRESLEHLDEHALLACQEYNYGNSTDWFGSFRGGLHGVYCRLNAVQRHYFEVHAWIPAPYMADVEYHLAALFFNMDSAMECMIFALNALGNCVSVSGFRDVTDERSLKRISPVDVFGDPNSTQPREPLIGYKTYFPTLQSHWQNNRELFRRIVDQHDVSKHRETIFQRGQCRKDPPSGFYERMGLAIDDHRRCLYAPMAEIFLHPNPKSPKASRTPTAVNEQIGLEPLVTSFCDFMSKSGQCALSDAKANISLKHYEFIK